jgi:hypothetical protein
MDMRKTTALRFYSGERSGNFIDCRNDNVLVEDGESLRHGHGLQKEREQ